MNESNEITKIRESVNIIDIISSYLPLTQKGKNYFGVCPFHDDTNPSMSVSAEKQIYKCFSCGAAGNVFTFVKDYENVSFLEAVKIVADKSGMPFNYKKTTSKKVANYSKEYEIMALALKFYQNNLNTKEGKLAQDYLKTRNMSNEIIKDFDLGLALSNASLYKLLQSKNYDVETIVNLGLVNQNGEYLNDVFKDRIIFPIHDLTGNPIGFTGRIYKDSNQAKYINSKESNIFKKGEILFNYHRAISEIKKKKTVIVVEGNMDAIRLYASGIKNVVALMGTSLTKEQIAILKNTKAQVILMLDNDNAGLIGTYQDGILLEKAGVIPEVVRLSGEKDPDSYIIKNGIEAIIKNIESPISFLDFELNYFKQNKDLTKTTDLVQYIKEIVATLNALDDELTKELTIQKISKEYDIPLDLLTKELKSTSPPKVKTIKKTKELALSKYDIACYNILYYMMNDTLYIERFKKELGYFNEKKYRSIANEIIYYYDTYKSIDLSSFITFISPKDYIYDDVMAILKKTNIENTNIEDFLENIKAAKDALRKEEIKKLKIQINNELDEAKRLKLGEKLVELKKEDV